MKYLPHFLMFLMFTAIMTLKTVAQKYDDNKEIIKLGEWRHIQDSANKMSISLVISKQKILEIPDFEQIKKTVSNIPKYRYELKLISKSTKNNSRVNTWIYGTRVFIDSVEVTRDQFPNGFTAVVDTKPTVIYWYETSRDNLNIKIVWESSKIN